MIHIDQNDEEVGLTIKESSSAMLALVFQSKMVLIRHKFVKALNRVESAGKLLLE